ncbi:MAG: phage tail assembly protein [Verrucomicrobium sp.]|nr:phage tail assembly protein [Verrucomicrobium sp.]
MSKKIILSKPITVSGTLVDTLEMREPSVGDLRVAQKGRTPEDAQHVLLANLLQITPKEADSLSLVDYGRVGKAFQEYATEGGDFLPSEETAS